jgi:DNA (cytosine-5)-methyltransferase 1
MTNQIPIIDLFAGPGGLGEGFTSVVDKNNNRHFRIALSIEKDEFAHKTLTLRSFTRQFPFRNLPEEYYKFIRGEIKEVEILYRLYPKESARAMEEAWRVELASKAKDSITHEEIDKRIRKSLNGYKDFVLIGGPPCQAYSLVGRARRKEKEGLNKEDERVYLYREYYRILAIHRPAVFIMENVKGLLSSRVENELIFEQLVKDLQDPIESYKKLEGQERIYKSRISYNIYSLVEPVSESIDLFGKKTEYKPSDFIIRSEDYGIPQTRHRVILLGIRSDLKIRPELLRPFGKKIRVEQVLNGLPALRSGLSKTNDGKLEWKETIEAIKYSRLAHSMDSEIWDKMIAVIDRLRVPRNDKGGSFVESEVTIGYNPKWYLDPKINGTCNHESRSHIKEDLYRYLFVSCFAKVRGRSPKISDFPEMLLPKHENIYTNKFSDRFRVQLSKEPAKTITSHISKDGHYYIHPDPGQCRSLTVREAARIQTFPDNYYFCGPRTEQFHQVGNAVPPLLAKQIGEMIKIFFY